MKIAFVNQPMDGVIPPHQNSIGIWTYQVARRLATTETVAVYAKHMRTQNQWHGRDNVTYHFIRATPNRVMNKATPLLSHLLWRQPKRPFFAALSYYLDYSLQVALHLRRQKFDIIHIHNFTQFIPVIRALNPHAKLIIHMNGEWLSQLHPPLIHKRLQQVDAIFGSSNYITDKVRQRFPSLASRCHTIYNGVDTNIFHNEHPIKPASDNKHLLFVGRVSPEKAIHILLDAFTQVIAHFPNTHLTIAGPSGALPISYIINLSDDPLLATLTPFYDDTKGDYWHQLHQQLPTHLAQNVTFTGGMPQNHLVEHYRQTDVLVNPSFSESFGMSLAEAMAMQRPVIATRVGGMVELVDNGKTGLLIPPNDANALAQAIINLLQMPASQRQAWGIAGRQKMLQHFSWDQVAATAQKQYHSLIAN